ncbi:sugar ABC transporter ATP-binding protein [Alicyclobacillaceae bacterium I2511]|nr:sugar ABC transporter ATP-binding protein [Alicyclobacillaceae bacterium I2511]
MRRVKVLELQHITKSFFGNKALDDVTFTAYPGEIHALVGQNGAGKSTLMKILSGAYTADSGKVFVDDKEVLISSPKDAEGIGISIVYQELSLFPHLSVAANIVIGEEPVLKTGLLDEKSAYTTAKQVLERLGVDINPKRRVSNLNVSQQQICEIAKAISKNPRIVILDEPTASLTKAETDSLFAVMRAMRDGGLTLIFISHHIEEVFAIADRCTVLRDGRVAYTGEVSGLDERQIVDMMVGHSIEEFYPVRMNNPSASTALEIRNFGRPGIGPVSLKVQYGEILGIAGLIGSGRSELVRMIFGADKYTNGEILLNGESLRIRNTADAIRAGIALVTEDRRIDGLNLSMPIRFNISLPNIIGGRETVLRHQFVRRKFEANLVLKIAEAVKLKYGSIDHRVVSLSGGNQQKVAIGKWISTGAKIFIFDEPTKGIDVASKAEIYRVINELADSGAAVIVISSYNPELIGICNRIFVMSRGNIIKKFDSSVSENDLLLAQSM